jgi:hypothetical protein
MKSFTPLKVQFEAEVMVATDDWDPIVFNNFVHNVLSKSIKEVPRQFYLVGMTKTNIIGKGKTWKN